ncbi:Crp/Fnr family transcriptional regulator [Bradyrhizobium sp. Arg237L]|uniref:Crp/Fnr family transcriptional regulator n=1 Tax=Bradyrhizobium sp. Arg237L TaxID=3003352 RepID=UPI00249F2450|nr:Crp/Fnr family transcriptional regulator [Bradyrhizobium sp. Arg237L]MDI4237704.1 Crp/Fnr family transcriptional regulator [Bradyrhizobium sp. Arg237L]
MSGSSRPSNHLLQTLPAAEFELLRPHLAIVELTKDTVLFEAGAPIGDVYLPHSGVVSLIVGFAEGETVEVAKIGRDSIVGGTAVLHDGPSLADAVVIIPGIASVLATDRLRAAMEASSALRQVLVRHQQALSVQAQQAATCHASHTVESRLSRWLLHTRELCGGGPLALTQECLSQLLGVRRNAISIVAHAFQEAGLIRYSRGNIEIIDLEGLQKAACECYTAVRTQCGRLLKTE